MSDAQTPTSVQEARASVYLDRTMSTDADLDALVAAVRAERDAEIRGMVEGMVAQGYDDCSAGYALKCVLRLLSDREGV